MNFIISDWRQGKLLSGKLLHSPDNNANYKICTFVPESKLLPELVEWSTTNNAEVSCRRMCINNTFANPPTSRTAIKFQNSTMVPLRCRNRTTMVSFVLTSVRFIYRKISFISSRFIVLLQCRTIISSFDPGKLQPALKIIPLHEFIEFIYSHTETFLYVSAPFPQGYSGEQNLLIPDPGHPNEIV